MCFDPSIVVGVRSVKANCWTRYHPKLQSWEARYVWFLYCLMQLLSIISLALLLKVWYCMALISTQYLEWGRCGFVSIVPNPWEKRHGLLKIMNILDNYSTMETITVSEIIDHDCRYLYIISHCIRFLKSIESCGTSITFLTTLRISFINFMWLQYESNPYQLVLRCECSLCLSFSLFVSMAHTREVKSHPFIT